MDFRQVKRTVLQTYAGNALSLTPPTTAIELAKPRDLPNSRPDREGFDVCDVTDNLELHRDMLAKQRQGVKTLRIPAHNALHDRARTSEATREPNGAAVGRSGRCRS